MILARKCPIWVSAKKISNFKRHLNPCQHASTPMLREKTPMANWLKAWSEWIGKQEVLASLKLQDEALLIA